MSGIELGKGGLQNDIHEDHDGDGRIGEKKMHFEAR
jgi:hypothetical protein